MVTIFLLSPYSLSPPVFVLLLWLLEEGRRGKSLGQSHQVLSRRNSTNNLQLCAKVCEWRSKEEERGEERGERAVKPVSGVSGGGNGCCGRRGRLVMY